MGDRLFQVAMSQTLSIIILTFRRDEALALTLDKLKEVLGPGGYQLVLLDNNTDNDGSRSRLLDGFENAVLLNPGRNVGVAEGRNIAMTSVTGDIVLFLDDDAWLEPVEDFTKRLVSLFDQEPKLSAVAFRSFVGDERREDVAEFPHTNKSLDHSVAFETFRFIGVAHAVRKSAFDRAGGYCSCFFYGMEEFDLSYRMMKSGGVIRYRPEFSVRHMKNDEGRLPSDAVRRRMFANKLSVAWMHLPAFYFSLCFGAWFAKTLLDTRSVVVPFCAISDFLSNVKHGRLLKRSPSRPLVARIAALGGVAWR